LSLSILAVTPLPASASEVRFDGTANDSTPVFEQSGPWMLDWSTHSDDALPKIFELRLYDADSGEFVGTIVQLRETGSSRRMFEKPGRYRIDVVASHLEWTLLVTPVETAEAARLKRRAEGRSSIEDTTAVYARQVAEDDFESWRPEGNQILLLFAKDEAHGFRVIFARPCPGLDQATALMFMAAGYGSGGELYDAIMLDDGTHCPFERVIPTIFD
jgi:hypothetical protein